jgi:N-methylhydantoinase B
MEAVMKAFEHVVPDRVGSANIDLGNVRVYGTNSRTGRFFVASDLWATAMSAGGAKGTDGWGGYAAPFCALKLPSLEMYERQFPFAYISVEYAKDTAAPGEFRGAPALHYRRRMTDSVRAIIYNQGYDNTMQGYLGGDSGAGNYFVLNEGAVDEMKVPYSCYDVPVKAGNVVFAQSGAGGGWGDPLKRDPKAVLNDVLNEYVSIERARTDYGVVIDAQRLQLDEAATVELRARARQSATVMAK